MQSPPHMRGKDIYRCRGAHCAQITPAHAGKRLQVSLPTMPSTDHPRTCGEKCRCENRPHHDLGSPPHMRGKVYISERIRCAIRITPAHAGKSLLLSLNHFQDEDHPRTCGEKLTSANCLSNGDGSPPHMRGKVYLSFGKSSGTGITSAHAGKRFLPRVRSNASRDHPRTCGEKS